MKLWRQPLDARTVVRPHGEVQIDTVWCKGCTYCVEYCPRQVLVMSTEFNTKGYHFPLVGISDDCLDCKLCERICPEYAVVVVSTEGRTPGSITPINGGADGTSKGAR